MDGNTRNNLRWKGLESNDMVDLENKKEIIGTLFEASKKVDDGKILCKTKINTEKITLVDDLRRKQMLLSEKLITFLT